MNKFINWNDLYSAIYLQQDDTNPYINKEYAFMLNCVCRSLPLRLVDQDYVLQLKK